MSNRTTVASLFEAATATLSIKLTFLPRGWWWPNWAGRMRSATAGFLMPAGGQLASSPCASPASACSGRCSSPAPPAAKSSARCRHWPACMASVPWMKAPQLTSRPASVCRRNAWNACWPPPSLRRMIVSAHLLGRAMRTAFLRPQLRRLFHPDQNPLFFVLVIHTRHPPDFAQRQYLLKHFFGNHPPISPSFPLALNLFTHYKRRRSIGFL